MKISAPLLAFMIVALTPASGHAADRVHAGQWETTITVKSGSPVTAKTCITAEEASVMNGDTKTLRKYLEESTAKNTGGRCAIKDLEVSGNKITVTMACGKSETVSATTYHGDTWESSTTAGAKVKGRRLGACP